MRNNYKESTLKSWTKDELIEYIMTLQENLVREENGNNHMFQTIAAVMKKDPKFGKAVEEVLEVWNKSFGYRYE